MKIAVAPPLGHGVGQLMYVGNDTAAVDKALDPINLGLITAAGVVAIGVATGNRSLARNGAIAAGLGLLVKALKL